MSHLLFTGKLTCCDDLDTDVELLDDEFSGFCLEASPLFATLLFDTVVRGLSDFFLLKLSNIDTISDDMFFVLFGITVSGESDI